MKKPAVTIGLAVLIMTGAVPDAPAALNLSVAPLSGGNSLRFGRLPASGQVSKEVRVRITSTEGKQYQVFHRLIDSFLNEKNVPLGADAISTYTLLGSNDSGTLYAQNEERLGFADQLLYSSGSGGESDAFTVAYAIDSGRVKAAGNFFGRIQYTVRPVGGASQDDVILNVTVETSGELTIEIEGSTTADSVRLKYKGDREKEGFVRLSFSGNLGQEIQIFQEAETFPQDDMFTEIDDRTVMFAVSGSARGELFQKSPAALTRRRVLLYASQESEDAFLMNLFLDPESAERQKAGVYEGQLKYTVAAGHTERAFNIRLEVEIEPVFAIEVDLPAQGLSFERLLPDSPPVIREVAVTVKTNLGKPYMIMQNAASPLTSRKGAEIPDEFFTFKGEFLDGQAGKIVYGDYRPVPRGETSIFFSDNRGSPSRFKVLYRLRPFPTMEPGDYTTAIRYSLGEV